MNRIMKRLKGNEKGQALILVIILLAVGSLVLIPMMTFMDSGLNAAVIHEDKTDELYAADAGVTDAIWKIKMGVEELPDAENSMPPYYIEDINGKSVSVEITYLDGVSYRVVSTATADDGSDTTVTAIITTVFGDYSSLLDNAITSPGEVTLQPGSGVEGGIVCPEEPGGSGDYDVWTEDDVAIWPTAEELIVWYMRDVAGLSPEPLETIDVALLPEPSPPNEDERYLWPIYREGYLHITSSTQDLILFLGDPLWEEGDPLNTVYVTGDLDIKGSKEFTLDLNGQTIFVEGNVYIDPKVKLDGNGCIIAIGDIDFAPQMVTDPEEFVFVCSLEGTVIFRPQGSFTGAIAGNVLVQLLPGSNVTWDDPPDDINFPGCGGGGEEVYGALTWEIS